ncbi:MAG: hypothetical protein IPM53_28395 [Anaerolineaceae bacterium]|nr:hypothetical protein [Anaerolineaceae bacterium]
MNNSELTLSTIKAETAAALTCLSTDAPMPPFFKSLLIMRQRLHTENEASESVWHIVCGKLLLAAINQMAETRPLWADILKSHYIDRMTMRGIAHKLGYENRYRVDREQRKAIDRLAEILQSWEQNARQQQVAKLLRSLDKEPTYDTLFGAEEYVTRLKEALLAKDHAWLIAVTGLGGLGKTAVADQTIRLIIPTLRFQQIVAIYLEPGSLPLANLRALLARQLGLPVTNEAETERQIVRCLKAHPTLVFIDGFEDDISHLEEGLGRWANPSKILITSRHRPVISHSFFAQPIASLPMTAVANLIRQHAHKIGRMELATASDEQISLIHRKVGGNPLALKLIVGLSDKHTIPAILKDLTELKIEARIEEMYRRIYWQAWRALSQESQTVLKAMQIPDSAAGANLAYIASLCPELDLRAVSTAVEDLINRSLLETHGSAWEAQMRYRIHSLTKTFLQTEIIHYPDEFL